MTLTVEDLTTSVAELKSSIAAVEDDYWYGVFEQAKDVLMSLDSAEDAFNDTGLIQADTALAGIMYFALLGGPAVHGLIKAFICQLEEFCDDAQYIKTYNANG